MDKQAELNAKLETLRQSFVAQLPTRFTDIDTAWQQVLAGDGDQAALATVHRLVHSLTGTAGTFGMMELSEHARATERLLKGMVAQQDALAAPERDQVATMIAQLRDYVDGPEPAPQRQREASRIRVAGNAAEGPRVLLMTRDRALTEELSAQIEFFGYELLVAEDTGELLELADAQHPAALVIEAQFKDGVCTDCPVIPQIQERSRRSLPVIFLAATGSLSERVQAVRAGADAYLLKPLDVTVLVDHLDQLTGSNEAEPFRILVVDDDPPLAERYGLLLESVGMEVRTAISADQVMPALVELQPDLILMDLYMPDCSGTELARVIRQQDAYVSLPIVFLSSETDLDKQFDAMSLGGDDFLTKPIRDDHLIKAVRNRAVRSRLIHSLMARDSLTGLLKHTKIKESLAVELSRAERQHARLSYVMLDIDHFKRVNDEYGHLAGDRVIKSIAHLLRQRLRKSDIIGRYGGEEFAVIMPDTRKGEAAKVIDSVRIGFSMIHHTWHEEQIRCTFSAGVAEFPEYTDADQLTHAADAALYKAKEAGRNRVMVDAP